MSLEAALENANASIRDLVESLGSDERIDVASLPAGALDWAIAEAARAQPDKRFIPVTASPEEAYRPDSTLRFPLRDDDGDVRALPAAHRRPLLAVRAGRSRRAGCDLSRVVAAGWGLAPLVGFSRRRGRGGGR